MARPEWLGRYGVARCLVSIVAMSSAAAAVGFVGLGGRFGLRL
jgi:hypothetical protein